MGLSVVILAAGKGKRMASNMPKILHSLGGIPLLERVVNTVQALKVDKIHVVYGNGGSAVRDELNYLPVHWVEQQELLGTGHAVLQALPHCQDNDQVLVLYGDVPLISLKTLRHLLESTPRSGLGLVVAELKNPTGLGRIIRNEMGNIIRIVEHKDATPMQLKIHEINTGIMIAQARHLKNWLPKLKNSNRQKEYYLTDAVALAVADGYPVGGIMAHCPEEVQGVNDRWELANLERYFQRTMAKKLALAGATIIDPRRLDVRGDDVHVAHDVTIDVNVVLEGKIRIGKNSKIGPHVVLKNVTLGNNVEIRANTVIEDATIASNCIVGPFAHIRPGSVLEKNVKIGNFVEIKKTTLGVGSKANHLTYLGDTTIGSHVNIGAGTITCNYDGTNKWRTTIKDYAFIGSNTALVAPVIIAEGATIGAGSTITQNAPANQLTIGRARQHTVDNWQRPDTKKD